MSNLDVLYGQFLERVAYGTACRYIEPTDPTVDVNPSHKYALWFNYVTGEWFICLDNTPNKNIWRGDKGSLVQPATVYTVDIFGDGSCKALWPLDNTLNDLGGIYNGSWWKNRPGRFVAGKFGYAVQSYHNCQVVLPTPFDSSTTLVTVSAWLFWYGSNGCMPLGWYRYDLYVYRNHLGFNTGHGDLYGFDFRPYRRTWVHIVAEFHKGEYGRIWLNGELMQLKQVTSRINTANAVMDKYLRIFGWGSSSSYRNFGLVDHVRIFDRQLTETEILQLYHEHA